MYHLIGKLQHYRLSHEFILEHLMTNINSIYDPVIALAKQAGELQRESYRKSGLIIETKSTAVDMVTEVDLACDALIVQRLKALFPDDLILSEEQGFQPQNTGKPSAFQWIIDPLDGTTNFSIGHPIFAVSIARWKNDLPEFGVVYVPMLDELYVAERGRGAYWNAQRLKCSTESLLNRSVLATGFPYDRATAENNNADNVRTMIPLVKGIRRLGAAAYDLCLVAAGVYDAYWELRLAKWDLAAGRLMIEEAGGTFWCNEEGGKYNVITGSKAICDQLHLLVDMKNSKG